MGRARPATMPLYPSEEEIADAVLGPGKLGEWMVIALREERRGLPMVDPVFGARFWPAVVAYLERRHGLRKDDIPQAADGKETWHAEKRRRQRAGAPADAPEEWAD
jgi:hypothetical protein